MFWQGYVIKVDAGIEPLLILFNEIPGIATVASCVGDQENLGYVAFAGDSRRAVKQWVRKFEKVNRSDVLQEVAYREDTGFGCVRFEHARIDDVCNFVLGLTDLRV
jgi:tRNA(Phe) wybutosine-synthesizing methylase Tyw3